MIKGLWGNLLRSCRKLLHLGDSPHAIAGGVSIGFFLGITPLFGIKTVAALLIAWGLRCSKTAAVTMVTLHDFVLPLWPLVLRWEYMLGYWLLSSPHHLPPKLEAKQFEIANLIEWRTLGVLWPILLGSLLLAVPATLVCYWVSFRFFSSRKDRKAATCYPDIHSQSGSSKK